MSRAEILKEIVASEQGYVHDLTVLIQLYLLPLRSAAEQTEGRILTHEEIKLLFSNVELIVGVNQEALRQLLTKVNESKNDPHVGVVFLGLAPYMKMYRSYCAEYMQMTETFKTLTATNPNFSAFLRKIDSIGDARGLDLPSLQIMPIQRIPKYILLLKRLHEKTPEGHPDRATLEEALKRVEEVATSTNEAIRHAEQMVHLVDAQRRFGTGLPFNLIEPARKYVRAGRLSKITSRFVAQVEILLFTDMLIYAYPGLPGGPELRFKGSLELNTAWVRPLKDTAYVKNGFQIVCPKKTYTFYTETPDDKTVWMKDLNRVIDAMTARNPSLIDQRGQVRLTKRAGFWQAFTVGPSQYDPDHKDVQYIEGNDEAAPGGQQGESTPLIGRTRGVSGTPGDEDPGCCSSCTIQ